MKRADRTSVAGDAPRHYSPTRLAFRRMRHHKLGMLGLVFVLLMGVGVILVPSLSREEPETTRPWLGTCPPLSVHPDCAAENLFAVGRPAETTPRAARCASLRIAVEEATEVDYRIVLRRGRISSIQQDARQMSELDLAALAGEAREVLSDNRLGPILPALRLEVGGLLPEGFVASGQRVLILRAAAGARTYTALIRMGEGVVESVTISPGVPADAAAVAVDKLTIKGAHISSVQNGETNRPLIVRHPFGTDELGRDLFVRVFYGGRISLLVGIVATAVSLIIGLSYGAVAGYAGGRVDRVMMGIVDILYALPFLFLVIILMVSFGRNIIMLFVALGAVQWLTMARIVRGQILSLKQMEFVEAARLGGARPWHIVFRELIPHTLGPVIVYTTLTVPVVIMGESFLAFIGLQVQYHGIALDSWGSLINRGVQALGQSGERSWLLVFPSLAMVLTLFGLNSLGDGLRDSFDPKGTVH